MVAIPTGIFVLMGGIWVLKRKRWLLSLIASINILIPAVMFWGFWRVLYGHDGFLIPILPPVIAVALTVLSKK